MKNKIFITVTSFILIITIILLIIGFTNKTFFKTHYNVVNLDRENVEIPLPSFSYFEKETATTATFSTLRNVESIRNILGKYVEYLKACYDEGYFYDANLNITISQYYVEDGFPFNKIYLVYNYGNYCENEFVLPDDWITNIKDNSVIKEANIKKCDIENTNVNCITKPINKNDLNNILDYVSTENVARIENKNNISLNESKDHYSIDGYYLIADKGYYLSVFINDNNYLAFRVTDGNDHSKNAIYNVGAYPNQVLENTYNKY